MSEEVVNNRNVLSIDPESIAELLEFRNNAIDAYVSYYTKNFDKIFAKISESLNGNEEELNKFKEIREKHLKDYENYIENRLERRMRQLFEDKSIANQLVYISDNFDKFPKDLIAVQSVTDPIRNQFIERLKTFEQSVDERLETKTKELEELTESLTKAQDSYESLRKSVQTKVLTIIKDLDSIEIKDLESSLKSTE